VTFSKGSAALDASFTPVLDQVAKSLNLYPKTTITSSAPASTEGAEQANLDLSYRRAQSVSTYLQGQGRSRSAHCDGRHGRRPTARVPG